MDSRERVAATIERKPVDRPAAWLGLPTAGALDRLCRHLGVSDGAGVREALGDDIEAIEMPYHSPTADAIYAALDFAKRGAGDPEHRTLNAPGVFEDVTDPAAIARFPWPDPAGHVDRAETRRLLKAADPARFRLGVIWSAHFQDACAAFGLENALMTMLTAPDMFRAVTDRIVAFYLRANEIFYAVAGDRLDAVLIGNDFGTQSNLLLSPDHIRTFAFPGTRALVAQAREHGLRVFHHSCGAIRPIIGDLIEMGVDVIHPIQARAQGMDAATLQREFGGRVAFCGGVDTQALLAHATPDEVRAEVRRLRGLFPTGLIVSPSHEALLPDVDPANVVALFDAVHEDACP